MTMKAIQIIPQNGTPWSAEQFISFLRLSSDHWWDSNGRMNWIFRGHANADWNLLPHGLRPIPLETAHSEPRAKLFAAIEKLPNSTSRPETSEVERAANIWSSTITEAVHQFKERARIRGFLVDPWSPSPLQSNQLFHNAPPVDRENFQNYALAQHHGIPTHLLDWTEDPMIACYFGCRPTIGTASDIAVWALNETAIAHSNSSSLKTQNLLYALFGRAVCRLQLSDNIFMRTQKGVFTSMEGAFEPGMIPEIFRHGRWHGADELLGDECDTAQVVLKKIVLPAAEVPRLRVLLLREGFAEDQLMPTLDNIAKVVRSLW